MLNSASQYVKVFFVFLVSCNTNLTYISDECIVLKMLNFSLQIKLQEAFKCISRAESSPMKKVNNPT